MIDFNKFKESELFYFIKMLILTIIAIVLIFEISDRCVFKKVVRIEKDLYEITVEDHICKCNIKYYSDTINMDKLVYFKSEGIEYEIDSSLVRNICIKF